MLSDVSFAVDMGNTQKKHRVFHINMLRKWNERSEVAMFGQVIEPDLDGDSDKNIDVEPVAPHPGPTEVELPTHLDDYKIADLEEL